MPETLHDRITYDVADGVARIELAHSGAHNSLDLVMGRALHEAAARAAADAGTGAARVVVVTARGRTFSVGGDLAHFAAAEDRGEQVGATARELHAGIAILRSLEVPVVSVVHGTAAGGGLGIALVGDIVLAAAEAKLVLAYTASGLTPDCGLTWILARDLPRVRALDLVLTNRVLTGAEAEAWGLVSRAVPADELTALAETVVTGLRDGASAALRQAKRLVLEAASRSLEVQLDAESAAIARLIGEPDGIEGVDAFLEKRRPVFG